MYTTVVCTVNHSCPAGMRQGYEKSWRHKALNSDLAKSSDISTCVTHLHQFSSTCLGIWSRGLSSFVHKRVNCGHVEPPISQIGAILDYCLTPSTVWVVRSAWKGDGMRCFVKAAAMLTGQKVMGDLASVAWLRTRPSWMSQVPRQDIQTKRLIGHPRGTVWLVNHASCCKYSAIPCLSCTCQGSVSPSCLLKDGVAPKAVIWETLTIHFWCFGNCHGRVRRQH